MHRIPFQPRMRVRSYILPLLTYVAEDWPDPEGS